MAKTIPVVDDDMRPEYDFSGGVRGKHYKFLREEGYVIRVYNDDGTVTERHVAGERTVVLEPDVYEYFPSSQAVNQALRTLISLVPKERLATATPQSLGPNRNSLHLDHCRRGVPGDAKQPWPTQPCGELVEPKDEAASLPRFVQKPNTKLQARLSVRFSQARK